MDLIKFLCIPLLVISITGCVSDFNASLPSSYDDILVVQGDITENTEVNFYLSKSFDMNENNLPEENKNIQATIVLVGSDGTRSEPAVNTSKGVYKLAIGELKDNVSYGIEIIYDGNTYISEPSTPFKTSEIDSITWNQPEHTGALYFQISTHGEENASRYYMWNYEEDWEITAAFGTDIFFNPQTEDYYYDHSMPNYYCWKNNKVNEILIGSAETLNENKLIKQDLYTRDNLDDRFSLLYSVNVTQRSISKAAYEYYLNKKKLSEEMGGLFTPQPSEVEGNISCLTDPTKKVIGFINVSKNVTEKRIFIETWDVSYRNTYSEFCGSDIPTENMPESLTEAYKKGYRPATIILGGVVWSTQYCTMCQMRGGTKNKPDFWPNDHK